MGRKEEDDYNNWKNNTNSSWNSIGRKIGLGHIIGIIILFLIFYYLYSSDKINVQFFIGGIIMVGFIIVFLIIKPSKEKPLLPEHVIKRIGKEALEQKRLEGKEIPPDAKIRIMLVGEAIFEQDFANMSSGIIRRDVGFEVIAKGLRKTGVISIHPYDGIILGIRFTPMGYKGHSSKDRQIIPVAAFGVGQQQSTNLPKP